MSDKPLPQMCIYHEAHVTIEPVFGERLELFRSICKDHGFKAANLLMQKDRTATAERSDKDTFCTGHGKGDLYGMIDIASRMTDLVAHLRGRGFVVWREKIEQVVHDVKHERERTEGDVAVSEAYAKGVEDDAV